MESYKLQALLECTRHHYNQRKIVIWGKCADGELVASELYKQHGIETEFYIDINRNLVNGSTVRDIEEIKGKINDIYVVIPLRYHESIISQLDQYGYKAEIDYAYFVHEPVCVTKDQMNDNSYSDIYGNKITGDISNCKIILLGYNATITFGHSNDIQDGVEFYADSHARVSLGDSLKIVKNNTWKFWSDSLVSVGDHCLFEQDSALVCGKDAKLTIGCRTSIGRRYWIIAHNETQIEIGKDCLFSADLMIRTNDGHSIFDIHTGRNINSSKSEQKQKSVIIKDHVWIGARCSCLYNTKIGKGSIVGAHSIVKKEYPNNCIIAGSPAKMIRKDIAWAKENNADFMEIINEAYISPTYDI